jgi:hypothetical protein
LPTWLGEKDSFPLLLSVLSIFMYLVTICICFSENCLFSLFAH